LIPTLRGLIRAPCGFFIFDSAWIAGASRGKPGNDEGEAIFG